MISSWPQSAWIWITRFFLSRPPTWFDLNERFVEYLGETFDANAASRCPSMKGLPRFFSCRSCNRVFYTKRPPPASTLSHSFSFTDLFPCRSLSSEAIIAKWRLYSLLFEILRLGCKPRAFLWSHVPHCQHFCCFVSSAKPV